MTARLLTLVALTLTLTAPAARAATPDDLALFKKVQDQVLRLLLSLQQSRSLSLVLVTHDLAVVGQMCDRVLVMNHGRIVESGPTSQVLHNPQHAYTRALLSAVPSLDPDAPRTRIELDPAQINREAPLTQISEDHVAAV